jgi:WD40 repeat protein
MPRSDILEHRYPVRCVTFSADGKSLVTGGGLDELFKDLVGDVRLWDVATGEERAHLEELRTMVSGVALTPDGQTLVSASLGGLVRLWDVRSGRERQRIDIPCAITPSLTLSPDGRTLAVGGWKRDACGAIIGGMNSGKVSADERVWLKKVSSFTSLGSGQVC